MDHNIHSTKYDGENNPTDWKIQNESFTYKFNFFNISVYLKS